MKPRILVLVLVVVVVLVVVPFATAITASVQNSLSPWWTSPDDCGEAQTRGAYVSIIITHVCTVLKKYR